MKQQNGLFRLGTLMAAFAIVTLTINAQSRATRMASRAVAIAADVRPSDNWQRVLDWLNKNPIQSKQSEGGPKDSCRFEYKLLPFDISHLSAIEETELVIPVFNLKQKCSPNLVVPNRPVEFASFKVPDFDGTIFDPYGPLPGGLRNPNRDARARYVNGPVVLVDLEASRIESKTTPDRSGRFRFSQISAGRKALFFSDKNGNLIYADTIQVCGRGVDKDGRGCTEKGLPTR